MLLKTHFKFQAKRGRLKRERTCCESSTEYECILMPHDLKDADTFSLIYHLLFTALIPSELLRGTR